MKKLRFIAFFLTSLIIFSCSTVPLTNRKQLAMIPQGELLAMSFAQYNEFPGRNECELKPGPNRYGKECGKRYSNGRYTVFK